MLSEGGVLQAERKASRVVLLAGAAEAVLDTPARCAPRPAPTFHPTTKSPASPQSRQMYACLVVALATVWTACAREGLRTRDGRGACSP